MKVYWLDHYLYHLCSLTCTLNIYLLIYNGEIVQEKKSHGTWIYEEFSLVTKHLIT